MDFKQADLSKVKELIKEKTSDGDLNDADISDILEETRSYYKETPLTESDIFDLYRTLKSDLDQSYDKKAKVPITFRVIGVLSALMSVILLPSIIDFIQNIISVFGGSSVSFTTTTLVLVIAGCVLSFASAILSILTGVFMFLNKRSVASRFVISNIAVTAFSMLVVIAVHGVSTLFFMLVGYIVLLVALSVYLHPQLHKEREFYRKLKDLDTEQRAEQNRLGISVDPRKGFIELDFFNLFWIFVVGAIIGLFAEDIFHMIFVWGPGEFHDRAGLLFGPFSPIYGFGAVIMTICLNRLYRLHPVLLFAACTVIGGAFEYCVSFFMEVAFGIEAWNYSNYFLNINGRTCLLFAAMFGVMGFIWIKWALPLFLKLISKIPWKLRYPITAVFATFMIINCIMTVQALDCWSQRTAGKTPTTPIEQFYAKNFDDQKMANRFESMEFQSDKSTRSDLENN